MNNNTTLTNHKDTAHKYLKRLKKAIKKTPSNMFMSEDRETLKSFMFDKENAWIFDDVYASEDFLSLDEIETDEEEDNCEQ